MSFKPYIAIGHGISQDGSWDTGCTWNGFTEAALAQEVVGGILEVLDANQKNYLTDYPENNQNIIRCVETANENNCSHYLSVHLDWDQAPSGIYPIYATSAGLMIAEHIRASMKLRIPGLNDRGNLCREDYEVRASNMPAVIMEIGSIKADNELIRNNTRLFGHAIAYGLLDAAGESYIVIEETGSTPVEAQTAGAPQPENTISNSGFNWDIENIQYFLNICNYGAPEIDGVWGPETKACLVNAQRAYNILVDGLWGPVTQAHAEQQIRLYQTTLNNLGFACTIDGIAGPETSSAVENFQIQNGLEADGIVGEQTFSKLFNPEEQPQTETEIPIVNFTEDEFKCECGCGGDIKPELKVKIQKLRNLLTERSGGGDRPLVITSGFRCRAQNERVGGVPDSLHMTGDACDLYTPGMSREMIDEISYCAHQVGLGVLRYYSDLFCHVQLYDADVTMN